MSSSLRAAGREPFLGHDFRDGIGVSEDWRKRLYRELREDGVGVLVAVRDGGNNQDVMSQRLEEVITSTHVEELNLSSRNEISYPPGDIIEPVTCDDANFGGFVVPFRLLNYSTLRDLDHAFRLLTVTGSQNLGQR